MPRAIPGQTRALDAEMFPKPVLWAAAGVLATVLAGTAAIRLGWVDGPPTSQQARVASGATAVQIRLLTFTEADDTSVRIVDGATGALVRALPPGEGDGFIRGVMRVINRGRVVNPTAAPGPLTLTHWSDGGLTLDDRATGWHLELNGFGHTNVAAFRALLPARARPETAR